MIRAIVLFLLLCTACKSGIIPCPEVKGLRLKKSQVSKRARFHERVPREEAEPIITVSSEAKTPVRHAKKPRYVKYTMVHVDVEELDCPRPGEKMPKAIKENIRKNRKKVRYYYQEVSTDSLNLLPATYPRR